MSKVRKPAAKRRRFSSFVESGLSHIFLPVRAGSVEQDLTYREYPRSGLLEHFAISSMFGDEFGDIDMFPEKSRSRMKGPQKQIFARVVGQDESGLAVLARLAAADGASPAHDRSNQ